MRIVLRYLWMRHTNCNDADRWKDAGLYSRKENRISMKNAVRRSAIQEYVHVCALLSTQFQCKRLERVNLLMILHLVHATATARLIIGMPWLCLTLSFGLGVWERSLGRPFSLSTPNRLACALPMLPFFFPPVCHICFVLFACVSCGVHYMKRSLNSSFAPLCAKHLRCFVVVVYCHL